MNSVNRFVAGAILVMVSGSGYCIDDFGPLKKAQKALPAIFVPGNVLVESCKGTEHYVCHGVAERCFSGAMAEPDSELYREAVADAKHNLFVHLTKGDKGKTVELSGATIAYQYSEDKLFHAICLVPKSKVVVRFEQSQRPFGDISVFTNNTHAPLVPKAAVEIKKDPVSLPAISLRL